MMSMFQSFDILMQKIPLMSMILIMVLVSSKIKKMNSFNFYFKILTLFMSIYFSKMKSKNTKKFMFNIFLTYMMAIMLMNIVSVFSYNFPLTSQMSILMFLSLLNWLSINLYSLMMKPKKFIYHLIPQGSPLALTSFMFMIEIVSNLIRPLTTSVRVVSNILAGHILMYLTFKMIMHFNFTFVTMTILMAVEMSVALIQSYIFVTMLSLFYNEM